MSTLLYGAAGRRAPVPVDEGHVRTTITVVQNDAPSAVAAGSPDFNDVDTDPDTDGGLTPRQLASAVTPSVRYAPVVGNANADLNASVNAQVSTSGTAAARELAGQWGHGTFKLVEGIEPVIRDGGAFGPEYFAAAPRPAAGSGSSLTPSSPVDPESKASAAASAAANSRAAYGAFLAQTTGVK